jgi:hypothetical protein
VNSAPTLFPHSHLPPIHLSHRYTEACHLWLESVARCATCPTRSRAHLANGVPTSFPHSLLPTFHLPSFQTLIETRKSKIETRKRISKIYNRKCKVENRKSKIKNPSHPLPSPLLPATTRKRATHGLSPSSLLPPMHPLSLFPLSFPHLTLFLTGMRKLATHGSRA